ncbi:unnamed protein product [Discosporangium mesarthrocarpum]
MHQLLGLLVSALVIPAGCFVSNSGMARISLKPTRRFSVFHAIRASSEHSDSPTETSQAKVDRKSVRDGRTEVLDRKGKVTPQIIPFGAPMPEVEDGVSVLSFNVLLPNSGDGWWIYKNYQGHVPQEHREWPHRQALLREMILGASADVVCIQEASANTFESDFAFMMDAGYRFVLHSKFRFRSATFYKTSRLEVKKKE